MPNNLPKEPVSTALEFTADDLAKYRGYGYVTRSGVVYHEELAGPGGMSFVLLREPTTTQAMLEDAVRQLRCDRDVVGRVKVTAIIEPRQPLETMPPVLGAAGAASIEQRIDLAYAELAQYDLGEGITVVSQDTWDCNDPSDLTKIVYIRGDDAPEDADSERVSFHVRFNPDGSVNGAYGLLMSNGSEIGQRRLNEHGLPLPSATPTMPGVTAPRMRG